MIVKAISYAFLALGNSQNLCTNVWGVTGTQEGLSTTMFWLVVTLHALTAKAWCHDTQRKPASFLALHFTQMSIHLSWKSGGSSYFHMSNTLSRSLPRPLAFVSLVLLCISTSFLFHSTSKALGQILSH